MGNKGRIVSIVKLFGRVRGLLARAIAVIIRTTRSVTYAILCSHETQELREAFYNDRVEW
jgi:hypothetical protein